MLGSVHLSLPLRQPFNARNIGSETTGQQCFKAITNDAILLRKGADVNHFDSPELHRCILLKMTCVSVYGIADDRRAWPTDFGG